MSNSTNEPRINGFKLMNGFYAWIHSNQDKPVTPAHISLYMMLLNLNNKLGWIEWFGCPYEYGLQSSAIGSRNTYYKCIRELQEWGLIEHKPGTNQYTSSKFKMCLLKIDTSTEHALILAVNKHSTSTEHIYNYVTSNKKQETAIDENSSSSSSLSYEHLGDLFNLTAPQTDLLASSNKTHITYLDHYLESWYIAQKNTTTDFHGAVKKYITAQIENGKELEDQQHYRNHFKQFVNKGSNIKIERTWV